MTINSKTLQELTGLSTRRLYHWVDTGVIPEEYIVSGRHPGSGAPLVFDESVVAPIKFLLSVVDWFMMGYTNGMNTERLKELFLVYPQGEYRIARSIVLLWYVE